MFIDVYGTVHRDIFL